MNFSQAKQTSIVDYLMHRGIKPNSVFGDHAWYHSPLRSESSASFKVDSRRNIWYDHGIGKGGTIIELVQALDKLTAIEALHALGNTEPLSVEESVSFHKQLSSISRQLRGKRVQVKSVKKLRNPALIQYAESRCIPYHIARLYLGECYYSASTHNTRNYFGLSFANDLGGYELRNPLWQGGTSPKAITTLPVEGASTVCVFEGFFDFLSAMVHFDKSKPAYSVVVLNSVALLHTALPTLRQYKRVNLFLDNDRAGQAAVETIRASCESVCDYSSKIYPNHKDFNEFLTQSMT